MVQFKFENSQDSLGKLFFVIIFYSFKKKKKQQKKPWYFTQRINKPLNPSAPERYSGI